MDTQMQIRCVLRLGTKPHRAEREGPFEVWTHAAQTIHVGGSNVNLTVTCYYVRVFNTFSK